MQRIETFRRSVLVCPAMHTEMWEHPAVQDNLRLLRRRGVHVVEPGAGAWPAATSAPAGSPIRRRSSRRPTAAARQRHDLAGLRVVVTAGGTREPIDPVRFIGNRSSGKQGYAVAEEAAARGAKVTLVTTAGRPAPAGDRRRARSRPPPRWSGPWSPGRRADIIVMAAAVADFRPVEADRKIKKADGVPEIVLEPTARHPRRPRRGASGPARPSSGFAAETDDLRANAADKLARKGIDLIVANDVSAPGVGFEHDTNQVMILAPTARAGYRAHRQAGRGPRDPRRRHRRSRRPVHHETGAP